MFGLPAADAPALRCLFPGTVARRIRQIAGSTWDGTPLVDGVDGDPLSSSNTRKTSSTTATQPLVTNGPSGTRQRSGRGGAEKHVDVLAVACRRGRGGVVVLLKFRVSRARCFPTPQNLSGFPLQRQRVELFVFNSRDEDLRGSDNRGRMPWRQRRFPKQSFAKRRPLNDRPNSHPRTVRTTKPQPVRAKQRSGEKQRRKQH